MRTFFAILFFPLYAIAFLIGFILRPIVFGVVDGIYIFEILAQKKYLKQAEKIVQKKFKKPVA